MYDLLVGTKRFSLIIFVLFLPISKEIISHSTFQHNDFRYLIHERQITSPAYHCFYRDDSLSKISLKLDLKVLEVFHCWEHVDVTIAQRSFTAYVKSTAMSNFRIKFTMPTTANFWRQWPIG